MSIIKDMLGAHESLFKNSLALDYDFQPKIVPHREAQMRTVASCMRPIFQKQNGRNLFIHGPPGVGKTVACKHLLEEIEQETDDIYTIYVNCWQKNTTFKILLEFANIVGYRFAQNKRTDELFTVLKQMINKKGAVIVLDEIDKLDEIDFLYNLLEELYRKSIILITNHRDWISELDDRIKSRLVAEMLEFKAYTAAETQDILKQRLEYAFVPGVFSDEAFNLISEKCADQNDVRSGLFMMKESALIAEDRASKSIDPEDVRKAMDKFDEFSIKKSTDLQDETRFILNIAKKNSGKKIGEMFKAYEEAGGKMVYKTFQRNIKKLEQNNFITTVKLDGGAEGKTTIVNYAKEKKLSDY